MIAGAAGDLHLVLFVWMLAGTLLVELHHVLLLALDVNVGEPIGGAHVPLTIQVQVTDIVNSIDRTRLRLKILLEECGVDHQPLIKVLRSAGSCSVLCWRPLLYLQDVLRPLEYPHALVHVVTVGGDLGDHLDVVLLLLLHLHTAGPGHLVTDLGHGAVVGEGQHLAPVDELILAGEGEADEWTHLHCPVWILARHQLCSGLIPHQLHCPVARLRTLEVVVAGSIS